MQEPKLREALKHLKEIKLSDFKWNNLKKDDAFRTVLLLDEWDKYTILARCTIYPILLLVFLWGVLVMYIVIVPCILLSDLNKKFSISNNIKKLFIKKGTA